MTAKTIVHVFRIGFASLREFLLAHSQDTWKTSRFSTFPCSRALVQKTELGNFIVLDLGCHYEGEHFTLCQRQAAAPTQYR